MRTHSQIVRDFGAANLCRTLQANGHDVQPMAVQRWAERDSIPQAFWLALATLEVTTLSELAHAADPRLSMVI